MLRTVFYVLTILTSTSSPDQGSQQEINGRDEARSRGDSLVETAHNRPMNLQDAAHIRGIIGFQDRNVIGNYAKIDAQAFLLRAAMLGMATDTPRHRPIGEVMGDVRYVTAKLQAANDDLPFVLSQVLLRAGMDLAWASDLLPAGDHDLYIFSVAFSLYTLAVESNHYKLFILSRAFNSGFSDIEDFQAPLNLYPDYDDIFSYSRMSRDEVADSLRKIYTEGKFDQATLREIEAAVIAELGADEDVKVIKLDE